nr:unnamed protein product [Callosobruchus analis]
MRFQRQRTVIYEDLHIRKETAMSIDGIPSNTEDMICGVLQGSVTSEIRSMLEQKRYQEYLTLLVQLSMEWKQLTEPVLVEVIEGRPELSGVAK